MELRIAEMQELKPIDFNFEEIKKELELKLKNYDTMIYSEDNIKAAKEDRATLNKLSKSLDTRRKEIKNEYMTPYMIFEEKMKELIGLVDNTSNKIDVQIKGYEDKVKQEKRISIEKVYEDNIGELKGLVSFDKLFREKWLNVSEKLSKVSQELIDEITRIKNEYEGLQQVMDDKELEDMKVFFFSTLSLERTLYQKKILDEEKAKIKAAEQVVKPEVSKVEVKEVKLYEVKFKVLANEKQLELLREFLLKNNIDYERID